MGQAGKALREVLTSQNKLATAMGLQRSAVYKWVHEERDPTALTVVGIVKALRGMNSEAAEAFIRLYLGESKQNQDPESKETRFFSKTGFLVCDRFECDLVKDLRQGMVRISQTENSTTS